MLDFETTSIMEGPIAFKGQKMLPGKVRVGRVVADVYLSKAGRKQSI